MFYALISALLLSAIVVVATSSVFLKLVFALFFTAAAYGLFRQYQPAPAALVDAENTVTDAAQTAYKGALSVEQTIEEAVRSHLPTSGTTPTTPVAQAPVTPVAPVVSAPVAPAATDTPKA